MLERLKAEMEKKTALHQELVNKYNEKMEEKRKIESEMTDIEKEIIHNQGAMQVINDLGVELLEKEEAPEQPKVVVSQSLTGRPSKLGANKKKIRLRKGDAVEHTIYGQGVVLEIRGDVATIAFGHTIGVKKLNASHPSLKKA